MRQKNGLFWHVHHDTLIEFCYSYSERVKYIRNYKPTRERKIRLQLFKPVKNLPGMVAKAWKVYVKAFELVKKADKLFEKASQRLTKAARASDAKGASSEKYQAYINAERYYNKKSQAHIMAISSLNDAYSKFMPNETLAKHMPSIEKLHKQECPNCPWDGKTIFPPGKISRIKQ